MTSPEDEGIRLQKVLSAAGVASRRAAEELIAAGRVQVNGATVDRQGRRVDPEHDVIRVDGARIPPPRRHIYLALNKPRGVVSTMDDPEGRPCLDQYVPRRQRVFHVGRLDTDTSGLLLLTNDGELANRLMHPRYRVPKVYLADVSGVVTPKTLRRLERGITLSDGAIRVDQIKVVTRSGNRTLVRLTLHEGRNRLVRRMLEAVGHPVEELSRLQIGPVRLGGLASGLTRELTSSELGALLDLVEL